MTDRTDAPTVGSTTTTKGYLMTRHRSIHTLLGTVFATTAMVALIAPPASARIVEKESFHDEFSFTDDNFCGAGLAVDIVGTVDGRFQLNSRGPGGLDFGVEKTTVKQTLTDKATGLSVFDIQPNTINKDLSLVDNGDGTLTAVVLLTGGERTYGHEGKLIASNSGQVRFEIVYDYVNNVEKSRELIFGSTGTNDDFCAAVLTDWGYPLT
jgi:hypothetical protein